MLITDTDALRDFCDALRDAPYLAVDTEFVRERTYHARLCLVQVAHGDRAAAVDPLARDIDLGPLRELLLRRDAVKVLHAASQDLEIFLERFGEIPEPVFDTQIAAAVCGHGEQPGYASLVRSMLGEHVDKASQATDWALRPLSPRQVDYALSDVTHLCAIYEILHDELARTGRGAWVSEEMTDLLDPRRYRTEPREAWRRIRLRRPRGPQVAILRELAQWREETAMRRDIPRGWVVRDEALAEIAQTQPHTEAELLRVRALKPDQARGATGRALLDAVRRGEALPESEWPQQTRGRPPLQGHESLVALLQALLRLRCEAHGVAMRLVATRADLDRLATEDAPDIAALHGWRRRIFGADALALRAGRLALTGDGEGVVAVPTPAGVGGAGPAPEAPAL